jgi:hypothetical protein
MAAGPGAPRKRNLIDLIKWFWLNLAFFRAGARGIPFVPVFLANIVGSIFGVIVYIALGWFILAAISFFFPNVGVFLGEVLGGSLLALLFIFFLLDDDPIDQWAIGFAALAVIFLFFRHWITGAFLLAQENAEVIFLVVVILGFAVYFRKRQVDPEIFWLTFSFAGIIGSGLLIYPEILETILGAIPGVYRGAFLFFVGVFIFAIIQAFLPNNAMQGGTGTGLSAASAAIFYLFLGSVLLLIWLSANKTEVRLQFEVWSYDNFKWLYDQLVVRATNFDEPMLENLLLGLLVGTPFVLLLVGWIFWKIGKSIAAGAQGVKITHTGVLVAAIMVVVALLVLANFGFVTEAYANLSTTLEPWFKDYTGIASVIVGILGVVFGVWGVISVLTILVKGASGFTISSRLGLFALVVAISTAYVLSNPGVINEAHAWLLQYTQQYFPLYATETAWLAMGVGLLIFMSAFGLIVALLDTIMKAAIAIGTVLAILVIFAQAVARL